MLVEQQTVSSWLSSGHQPPTLRVPVLRGGGQPGWLGGLMQLLRPRLGSLDTTLLLGFHVLQQVLHHCTDEDGRPGTTQADYSRPPGEMEG